MIRHRLRCIFVHIAKCGGSSVEAVSGGLQHLSARHVRAEAGAEVFNSYFKFAVVRDPYDKAASGSRTTSSTTMTERCSLTNSFATKTSAPESPAFFARLGIYESVPRLNASKRQRAEFTTTTRPPAMVESIYADDFRLLGYGGPRPHENAP